VRPILINKDLMVDNNSLQEITERELIAKANEAIAKMTMDSAHSPTEPKAIGAKKLHNRESSWS